MTSLSDTKEITQNPTTMESASDCEANGARNVPSQELVDTVSFDSDVDGARNVPSQKPDWSRDRRKSIKAYMSAKKKKDRFPLPENVYAFITVAPIISVPFMFSCVVILLKFTVYAILVSDVNREHFYNGSVKTAACKLLLLPVAIAMQEDLMDAYWFYANAKYNPETTVMSATRNKLRFSYFLRTVDGVFSLHINVAVMFTTTTTLAMFLNFAALQFLQSIDDVFYDLVCLGFFGDAMEHMSMACKKITLKRKHGKDNTRKFRYFRTSHLDSLLFLITLFYWFMAWCWLTFLSTITLDDGAGAPTLSPTALNITNPQP